MTIRLLDAAYDDLAHSVTNYNHECPGLGFEFANEFQQGVRRITDYPDAWQLVAPTIRRCLLRRFPYSIIYNISGDDLIIVAIMHQCQHPLSWRKRLSFLRA
jgi:plasmid stabilization system protein ParE